MKNNTIAKIYTGCNVFIDGAFKKIPFAVKDGKFYIGESVSAIQQGQCSTISDYENMYVFPGFTDVHVHFREPGFSYKETMESGSKSAAHGGYTTVCTMPNLSPAPDNAENIGAQIDLIEKGACIKVYPYGTITKERKGEILSDMESMKDTAIAFTDDGSGIQTDALMRQAMLKAKSLGKMIAAHCEDMSLIDKGGCIHKGKFAADNGFVGISSESEWKQVERDLELVRDTGCAYHVCHISTKETVELIRKAKAEGLNVTCETGPHYLLMSDKDLKDEGRFKMNPPLRDESDKNALIAGIVDGTIDMIATDHAPHSAEEKSKGLAGSAMGVVGLETAFSELYTGLVKTGIITLEKLIELMSIAPANRFFGKSGLTDGSDADFCIFDLEEQFTVDPVNFLSKGKASPFEGDEVFGACKLTVCNGDTVYCAQ